MSNNAAGDLGRAITHDPNEDWPTYLEIVAYWSKGHGRRGRRRSIIVDADQFFGRGAYGAPMPAEILVGMIDKLRRQGPYIGVSNPGVVNGEVSSSRRKS